MTIRRFWKSVTLESTAPGWQVRLDGRAIKSPEAHVVLLPSQALGQAVAAEWSQVETLAEIGQMPLTRLAFAATDWHSARRAAAEFEIENHIKTDLLVFLSPYPEALKMRETALWSPWIEWAAVQFGIVLKQTDGLVPPEIPEASLTNLRALNHAMSGFEAAAFMQALSILGSVILTLALKQGALGADSAMALSRVGETFQEDIWGHDTEKDQAVRARLAELQAVDVWFKALISADQA